VAIAVAILLILLCKRKSRPKQESKSYFDGSALEPPLDPHMMYGNPSLQSMAPIIAPHPHAKASTFASPSPPGHANVASHARQSSYTGSTTSAVPLMSHASPFSVGEPSPLLSQGSGTPPTSAFGNPTPSSITSLTRDGGPNAGSIPEPVSPGASTSGLTEEQAQLIRDLHSHRVPAAEIASVMETFRRERVSGQSPSHIRINPPTVEDAPPGYDFKGH
jgi:hypothetical protein